MTKMINARMLIGKCSCGRIARGSEIKKHIKEGTMGEHVRKVLLRVCVHHKVVCEDGNDVEFIRNHSQGPSGNISMQGFKS